MYLPWLIFLVNDQHQQYVFLMWIWNLCSARRRWQKIATSFPFNFAFPFFSKAILLIVYKIYYLEKVLYLLLGKERKKLIKFIKFHCLMNYLQKCAIMPQRFIYKGACKHLTVWLKSIKINTVATPKLTTLKIIPTFLRKFCPSCWEKKSHRYKQMPFFYKLATKQAVFSIAHLITKIQAANVYGD